MQPVPSAHPRSRWQRVLLVLTIVAAALLVLGLVGSAVFARSPAFHATAYEPPAPAPRFTLTDHTGGVTSLEELRGAPVLLFFGYAHCPDVCPLTLARLRDALDAAGSAGEDARVLLVTVDPARDTPEALAAYVRNFGPAFTGLTGSEGEIRALLAEYGIHAAAEPHDASVLAHTSAVFGIDREGMIRVLLRPDAPPDELRADVATLLEL
jgi:protein SCO1